MRYLLYMILIGCGFVFASTGVNAQVKTVPIEGYKIKKAVKFPLIDVRTAAEYQEGHLPKAVNIDFFGEDFAKQFDSYNKRKKIYLYCRSGGRSLKASKILDSLGFKKVVNLDGGFKSWSESGKETESQ